MTTNLWSVGSVSAHIGNIIGWTNVPTLVSGTTLDNMVEQNINYVEQFVSATIDSDAIPEKYQPAIIKLSQADVLLSIDSQAGGTDNVRLGDLSVSSGQNGGTGTASQLREEAMQRLKELSRKIRFKRVIGA